MTNIEKYSKIFEDYFYSTKEQILPRLQELRKPYDFILTKLYAFYFITNYISQYGGLKTQISEEKGLFTIYNKSALDLLGIFNCLYSGLEIQAGIIYRSLYETYIYNEFIFKDNTKEKIKLFYNFQFVERWNHIQESMRYNKKYLAEMGITEKSYEVIFADYNKFKNDYNPKYPFHWAFKYFNKNPNLMEICKALGEEYVKEYISVYGTSSKQTHPSSILGDYFRGERKSDLSINSPMYKDTIVSTAVMCMSYCSFIVLSHIKYFRIPDYKGISEYVKYVVNIAIEESIKFTEINKR